MKITAKWLREQDACEKQVETFEKEWPEGVVVSLGTLKRAAELALDLDWFAEHVLTPHRWKVYFAATQPHREVYFAATASILWEELRKQEGVG